MRGALLGRLQQRDGSDVLKRTEPNGQIIAVLDPYMDEEP